MMEQLLRGQGRSSLGLADPQTLGGSRDLRADAAPGAPTAVDEDGEGDEEAATPGEFEYFSDSPHGEDD